MSTAPLSRAESSHRSSSVSGDPALARVKPAAGVTPATAHAAHGLKGPAGRAGHVESAVLASDKLIATGEPAAAPASSRTASSAAPASPLPASPLPVAPSLDLPRVSVVTTKVVNMLGHDMAVQWLPLTERPPRSRPDVRGAQPARAAVSLNGWIDGLCHMVFAIGLRSISGAHPVFIEIPEELLLTPLVEVLDPRWSIVQLPAQLTLTPMIRERLKELRARDMVLSVSCHASHAVRQQAIANQVQWAHVDMGGQERTELLGLWPELSAQQVHLRGVQRLDEFRECRALGAHAYSGPLLSAPVTWSVEKLPSCDVDVLQQLRERLLQGADDVELADLIQTDPALLLRLLILACDGICGPVCRPDSTLDLIAHLRGPAWPVWIELLLSEALESAGGLRPEWAEAAAHLSLFMRLLIERLAPDRRDLQGQAALLGLVAHFRHTLPARMVGHLATPLMAPVIEDAWMHRQCLLGAVLDIGLRLMFNGQPMAPANGIVELFGEAGCLVRERRSPALHADASPIGQPD